MSFSLSLSLPPPPPLSRLLPDVVVHVRHLGEVEGVGLGVVQVLIQLLPSVQHQDQRLAACPQRRKASEGGEGVVVWSTTIVCCG